MNLEQAVQTIANRGFTDRQARFLILVARHSGVCVMRQYSAFAGIVFGQKTRKFFANLLRANLVSTYDCAHTAPASSIYVTGRSTRPSESQTAACGVRPA